jgi:predicted glycosyltransferase involved in capsule biosynthesis
MNKEEIIKRLDSMIEALPKLFSDTSVILIREDADFKEDEYKGFEVYHTNLIEDGKLYLGVNPFN